MSVTGSSDRQRIQLPPLHLDALRRGSIVEYPADHKTQGVSCRIQPREKKLGD